MNGEQRRRRASSTTPHPRAAVSAEVVGSGSSVGQPSSTAKTQAVGNWRHAVAPLRKV